MLIDLHLKGVGPAEEMSIAFKPRMNFITGDNGLGKSFLLDVAWWALTETWARGMAFPRSDTGFQPRIDVTRHVEGSSGPTLQLYEKGDDQEPYVELDRPKKTQAKTFGHRAIFDHKHRAWEESGRPAACADVVLYARVDGGISISEPYRSRMRRVGQPPQHALHFTAEQLFQGSQPSGGDPPRLEGLIRDWAAWKRENGEAYRQLCAVLKSLSPPEGALAPGELQRLSIDDSRHHPTISMPYGDDVPLVHASAAIRRVASLAYALVWAWREHHETARLVFEEPKRSIVFLVDEVEAHLHPRWQRRIVPALLKVMEALSSEKVSTQVITVTHSPLVLASFEPFFDPARDAIWTLDLDADRKVTLEEFPFTRHGGADDWLTSDIFDLDETGSIEAEAALKAARRLLLQDKPDPEAIKAADDDLKAALGGTDPFWMRWSYWRDQRLGQGGDDA